MLSFPFFSSRRKPIRKVQPRSVRLVLEALESRTLLSAGNPIVAENQLPGTPESVWQVGAGDPSILGFATNISVDHGQTVSFKIDDYATRALPHRHLPHGLLPGRRRRAWRQPSPSHRSPGRSSPPP